MPRFTSTADGTVRLVFDEAEVRAMLAEKARDLVNEGLGRSDAALRLGRFTMRHPSAAGRYGVASFDVHRGPEEKEARDG